METSDQSVPEVDSTDRMLQFLGGEEEEEQEVEEPEETEEEVSEESEEVEQEEAAPVELIDLIVNGEQVKKSKDEVIELAQKGADYTQKTQQLAEERRRVQAEINAKVEEFKLREAVVDHIAEAKSLESQLKLYETVDWNALVDSDPVQAMKLDRQYRDLQNKYQQKVGEINFTQQQVADKQRAFATELLQREKQSMLEAIPDWKDAAKAKTERDEIKAALQKAGFSSEEIEGLSDHRSVVIARKAMLYDKMMAKKPEVQKRVADAPKPVKPGTPQQRNQKGEAYQKTRDALRKTGRTEYAQSAIERLL